MLRVARSPPDEDARSSADSVGSILHLDEQRSEDSERFDVTFTIETFRGVERYFNPGDTTETFWFSWKIFNKQFESPKFEIAAGRVVRTHGFIDTVRVESKRETLHREILQDLPLMIYLCTGKKTLASCLVGFSTHSSPTLQLPLHSDTGSSGILNR